MPLFDLYCANCGRIYFDKILTYEETLEVKCQDCGEILLKRQSSANFTVKGFNAKNGYSQSDK